MKRLSDLIVLSFLFFAGCSGILNKEEADRSLKVLNSNLVNFLTVSSGKPEIKALLFLFHEPSSPVCIAPNKRLFSSNTIVRAIKSKGFYEWDLSKRVFEKKDTASNIVINFPVNGEQSEIARFILSEFESQDCKSRPEFPVKADAKIYIGGGEKLKVKHLATIQDNLPLTIESRITGDEYYATLDFIRTKEEKEGTLNIQFVLKVRGMAIMSANVDAKIEYSRQGYYLRFFDFTVNLFEHEITGEFDYSKIDPAASDYVGSFNRYSNIEIKENKGNKVGNIVLGKSGNDELLDYFVRFSDGEQVLLSSYLPVLKKLLDYKY